MDLESVKLSWSQARVYSRMANRLVQKMESDTSSNTALSQLRELELLTDMVAESVQRMSQQIQQLRTQNTLPFE